ncbi:MAG: regulatory iron-sulfur-containing complex subunit RicT [Kiritimatiellia bacterium]|nr:signal peptidase II [Lentisphaerota bacterium]
MFRIIYVDCQDPHHLKCYGTAELAIAEGDHCVFKADGLLDAGRVARLAEAEGDPPTNLSQVLRRATLQDQSKASENALFARTAWTRCSAMIEQLRLNMRLLKVRYSLDRSVIKLLYTAEERVDFRKLVQVLSAELRARVEMRQIGPRSAAAMAGGFAACGRRLCCTSWLNEFDNVNIRMAKQQGLAINPANLNGMCGRLKCCLRFEHACYQSRRNQRQES